MNRIILVVVLAILTVLGGFHSARAEYRLELPPGIQYFRFASSVDGAEAAWINPAALGLIKNVTLQYICEASGRFNHDYGFTVAGDHVGISYRHLDNISGEKYDEYIFSSGSSFGYRLYWGASYQYIKNGSSPFNKKHLWNIGLLIRQNPQLSFAAVFSNLNRSRIDDRKTDIEQIYSFSYKSYSKLFEVSVALSLSSGQSLSSAKYYYGLDVYPIDGLMLYSNYQSSDIYEIGFRFNLSKYFVGTQGHIGSTKDQNRTMLFAGYKTGMQPSVLNLK